MNIDNKLAAMLTRVTNVFRTCEFIIPADREDAETMIRESDELLASLAANPAPAADHADYVKVPKEPTQKMIDEGMLSLRCDLDPARKPQARTAIRAARNAYVTMLAAAPRSAPASDSAG